MKIAVLVKEVPDTWGDRRIDPATMRVDRRGDLVIDEINEKAVEVALLTKEAHPGSEVTAVTMGPASALAVIRKALAMGADTGIHIVDDDLAGSDAVQTSAALAAGLSGREFDLVIAGNESTDGRAGAIPAMLAERLGFAQLTFMRTLDVAEGTASGQRPTATGHVEVTAPLPAVVSVTEQIAEARFPSFKGIMSAKKKKVESLSIADLGLERVDTGGGHSWSSVQEVTERPARQGGTIITDDGSGGTQLAEFLITSKLI